MINIDHVYQKSSREASKNYPFNQAQLFAFGESKPMIKPLYNEIKATQAAALLAKMNGGSINYTQLIKLLYLADRESLLSRGRSITSDSYVSLDKGPVLQETLDRIKSASTEESYWSSCFRRNGYEVELVVDCPSQKLSPAEEQILRGIFDEYGHLEIWNQLIDGVMHQLPEWRNPGGSSIPISYHDILRAGGKSEAEIKGIEEDIENVQTMDKLLA